MLQHMKLEVGDHWPISFEVKLTHNTLQIPPNYSISGITRPMHAKSVISIRDEVSSILQVAWCLKCNILTNERPGKPVWSNVRNYLSEISYLVLIIIFGLVALDLKWNSAWLKQNSAVCYQWFHPCLLKLKIKCPLEENGMNVT